MARFVKYKDDKGREIHVNLDVAKEIFIEEGLEKAKVVFDKDHYHVVEGDVVLQLHAKLLRE